MSNLRVVIADDSPTARRLISAILSSDPELEVVGEATNGREAVRLTEELRPDVLTMDIHMPVLDGFEATEEIMASMPTPIVIVSASTMVQEVAVSMKALRAGALTLLLKPPGPGSREHAAASRELIETVKAMADVKVVRRTIRRQKQEPPPPRRSFVGDVQGWRVVGIAASTGGPPAVLALLNQLPPNFPAPIVLVQHIAQGFTEGLVAWLHSALNFDVRLAQNNETLIAGRVYVAPEDAHLGFASKSRLRVARDPPINRFRPSANYLFTSLAEHLRSAGIGVMLTGMGDDGLLGLTALHRAGGAVLAQDEKSCVVYGMPGTVQEAGIASASGSPAQLARELVRRVASE